MALVHIIEGPVGAGKSTFSSQLGKKYKALPLILDDWMVELFSPDRPDDEIWTWYAERKERCINQIFKTAVKSIACGHDVIVEIGLLRSQDRLDFSKRLEEAGVKFCFYVLHVPCDARWERVEGRNAEMGPTYSMRVSRDVFELASRMWEEPSPVERSLYNIEFIDNA